MSLPSPFPLTCAIWSKPNLPPREGRVACAVSAQAGWGVSLRAQEELSLELHQSLDRSGYSRSGTSGTRSSASNGRAQRRGVGLAVIGMLSAIDLDDQPRAPALKIDHIGRDGGLSPKVMSEDSQRPEAQPKLHLLERHSLSQRPCDCVGHVAPPGCQGEAMASSLPSRGGRVNRSIVEAHVLPLAGRESSA